MGAFLQTPFSMLCQKLLNVPNERLILKAQKIFYDGHTHISLHKKGFHD